MKIFNVQLPGCIFFILVIILFFFSICNAEIGSRKFWDATHYGLHFTGHQVLTNGFKISNIKAAGICFGVGYCQDLLDEMSKKGIIDKNGVLLDNRYGFDVYDVFKRNVIGFGTSWILNKFVIQKYIFKPIKIKKLQPIRLKREKNQYRSISPRNEFNIYRI